MSEMVERVARAICVADGYDPEKLEPGDVWGIDGHLPNGDPAFFIWKSYMLTARAAIEAMREPTEAMNEAGRLEVYSGVNTYGDCGVSVSSDTGADVWRAP